VFSKIFSFSNFDSDLSVFFSFIDSSLNFEAITSPPNWKELSSTTLTQTSSISPDTQIVQKNMELETYSSSLTHTDKISEHFDGSKEPTSEPMILTHDKKNPNDFAESINNTNNTTTDNNNTNRTTQSTISPKLGQTVQYHSSRFGDRIRSRLGSPSDSPQVSPFYLSFFCCLFVIMCNCVCVCVCIVTDRLVVI
jgi:hypothetical protein